MDLMEIETVPRKGTLCGICGEPHECSQCDFVELKSSIQDTVVPSKAILSLPNKINVVKMSEGSFSVISDDVINVGTRFGPFEAKKMLTLLPEINFPLKVFHSDDYFQEYYLDNSNEFECNWMYFIQAAGTYDEQNLLCYEDNSNIYYISIKKIYPGEHFKVWYSPYYAKKMNRTVLSNTVEDDEDLELSDEEDININDLVKKQPGIVDRKVWICKFCEKHETVVINFAIHILEHYSMMLRKVCEICKDSFKTRKSLKKHITFVHCDDKYANQIELEAQKTKIDNAILENNKKETVVGDPLLNGSMGESSLENRNVLLDHMMLPTFDMDQTNNILDNDHLNLGVDTILTENENFNFNIEESNEKFICDICVKSFSKLKQLVQHIHAHTAKYTCDKCLTIFSRKENLSSHSCNVSSKTQCQFCDRRFSLKKYLTRHIATKHRTEYVCTDKCKKVFSSSKTLGEHKCEPENVTLICNQCQKQFFSSKNLKRHMNVHYAQALKQKHVVMHMCEICSKYYPTKKSLNYHLKIHKEPEFVCSICFAIFVRKDLYLNHMEIHKKKSAYTCDTCDQRFTLKKYLTLHMLVHNMELKYTCSECPTKFRQKSNLKTHFKRMHEKLCVTCGKTFNSSEKLKNHCTIHLQKYFECPLCKHTVKLKNSLVRHFKKKHPDENIKFSSRFEIDGSNNQVDDLENVENNNICDEIDANDKDESNCDDIVKLLEEKNDGDMQDIDANLDFIVNTYDTNNLIETNFNNKNDNCKIDDDNMLDFNSLEMEFEKNFNIPPSSNNAVCLSMPELDVIDQNITFGENAYILDNGNIIEPIEEGKVVLYIMDKDQKSD